MKTIRTWVWMGIAEGVLILVLAAIAPIFINSTFPILGFFIWIIIMGLISGSVGYILWRLRDASLARTLFIRVFPDYGYLGILAFLDCSSTRVKKTIELWQDIHHEPEFQALNMSPLEFLVGHKNDPSQSQGE